MHNKRNGSYYTPEFLAQFIVEYVAPSFEGRRYLSVLEPSVGDGAFVKAFNNTKFPTSIKNFSLQAVERMKPELNKAEVEARLNRKKSTKYSFIKNDFLKFQAVANRRFNFILGNPPYIKKSLLNKAQIEICKDIHCEVGLRESNFKNIWSAFLLSSCKLLSDDGILALVLPAELLQVKFSQEIRHYLSSNFAKTEIFTFEELMFKQIGQDTIVLICYKQSNKKGQYYTHIKEKEQLENRAFKLIKNEPLVQADIKWTHHVLSSDDIVFLNNLKEHLKIVSTYCDSKPGIVTAANKYFIIDEKVETQYKLQTFTSPIIQKGFYVNGSIVFNQEAFNEIVNQKKATRLICFPNKCEDEFSKTVQEYLVKGKLDLLHERYKCKRRNNWYVVPNIGSAPDGFFFKRCHTYPKILKNEAKVLVTDSAYKIEMIEGFTIENLIHSFYNSLTLAFAEIEGRYYGGGVLELTPSEFKKLPLPYIDISSSDFQSFRNFFENKSQIEDVLSHFDYSILNLSLGLNNEEIENVQAIRGKLIAKRFRRS